MENDGCPKMSIKVLQVNNFLLAVTFLMFKFFFSLNLNLEV